MNIEQTSINKGNKQEKQTYKKAEKKAEKQTNKLI